MPSVDSTNTFVRDMLESGEDLPGMTLVCANDQTKGRGQVGNSWETEKGKNIIFSLLCHPTFLRPAEQFVISECMALAICETLESKIVGLSIKWPNDIYVGDKKISGTLIECDLMGKSISNCIIGVGININQMVFRSDAPNPISLAQITGIEHDREEILTQIIDKFCEYYEMIKEGKLLEIKALYMQNLYRRTGFHRYSDVRGEFMAEIADIEPTGHLNLRFENGNIVRYEFKEVRFVINN